MKLRLVRKGEKMGDQLFLVIILLLMYYIGGLMAFFIIDETLLFNDTKLYRRWQRYRWLGLIVIIPTWPILGIIGITGMIENSINFIFPGLKN
ncbi:MAG: hypothetical protein A2Y67_00655 [Candidatus Buchananbacteria bacterium RBG_13_39_9]|uniref:Uncharacterized protein n=1 Tax=Candidatus Buchananbacteria bacterium RBG_13_39_9 TaxID=1797531 RepID=A0A1G1XMQ1_9BACT|nr:MAG: hypothetical protein A2Y67_00655 [Candidatus Buchananbacteria bacterium RBG_13_39_9]